MVDTKATADSESLHHVGEMKPLVVRLRDLMGKQIDSICRYPEPQDTVDLADRFGFCGPEPGEPEILVGADVALELGHPTTDARLLLLLTADASVVTDGSVTVLGSDLQMSKKERSAFAQVLILAMDDLSAADPYELDALQNSSGLLNGLMARTLQDRQWLRISHAALAAGLDFHALGSAILSRSKATKGVKACEVLFISDRPSDVQALAPIAIEAEILLGRHRKLYISENGDVECSDLSCSECENEAVCDNLRDVVVARRRGSHATNG